MNLTANDALIWSNIIVCNLSMSANLSPSLSLCILGQSQPIHLDNILITHYPCIYDIGLRMTRQTDS